MNLAANASENDRLGTLKAVRDMIAGVLDEGAVEPKDLPNITRRLDEVMREINALETATSNDLVAQSRDAAKPRALKVVG